MALKRSKLRSDAKIQRKRKKTHPASNKVRKAVLEMIHKHMHNLSLQDYNIDIEYMHEDHKDDHKTSHTKGEMVVNRRYKRGTMRLYPKCYKRDSLQDIEETVSHELAHINTQHVYDLMTACYKDEGETLDAWESLTEQIARLSRRIAILEK